MQDLTFGEQVKIILSRKDMTIKELAKKVEARTGRKMSRQNLTQRLGRDNFQERDMRMIAEILGCPFQLNILDERTITENETQAGQKAESVSKEPEKKEAAETASEEPKKKEAAETVSEEPKKKEAAETASEGADEKGAPETVTKEPANDKPSEDGSGKAGGEESSGERCEKEQPKESNARVHERDITIGELVDIHEELDALMEKDTVSGVENGESQSDDSVISQTQGEADVQENLAGDSRESAKGNPTGNPKEYAQGNLAGLPGENEQRNQEGNPSGYPQGNMTVHSEESNSKGYEERTTVDYAGGYKEEDIAGYPTAYPSEPGGEHVEELLQEIEALEKTEKKEPVQEEKPHGWRAYLKQRFKKLGREQSRTEKETADTEKEQSTGILGQRETGNADLKNGNSEGSHLEGGYLEEGYATGGYLGQGDSEGMYAGGESEGSYTGGMYGAEVETYGEADEEEAYSARAYVGGYSETEYSARTYEEEYLNGDFSEETYQLEMPQEDEEDKGEVNPYTGKEYESNSVRMHPSRIGYVQVYDRANHEWTDMTEWAFLGYQERKKQLLGKDYDPPIYLD